MKVGFRSPVEEWDGSIRAEGRRKTAGQRVHDECSGRTRLTMPGHALGLVRRPRIELLAKRLSWCEPVRCNPAWSNPAWNSNPAWRELVRGWSLRAIAECGPRRGRRRARVRRQIPARGLRAGAASLFQRKTRWGFGSIPAAVRAETLRKGEQRPPALAGKIGRQASCLQQFRDEVCGESNGQREFVPSGHEHQPLQKPRGQRTGRARGRIRRRLWGKSSVRPGSEPAGIRCRAGGCGNKRRRPFGVFSQAVTVAKALRTDQHPWTRVCAMPSSSG